MKVFLQMVGALAVLAGMWRFAELSRMTNEKANAELMMLAMRMEADTAVGLLQLAATCAVGLVLYETRARPRRD